jgi:hypothetical protein
VGLAQIVVESFLTVATIFCKIKKATVGSSFFSLQKKEQTKKLETDSWKKLKKQIALRLLRSSQ